MKDKDEALRWYQEQAMAAQKAMMVSRNTDAMTAILHVLALDGGRRAADALRAERLQNYIPATDRAPNSSPPIPKGK